MADKDKAVNSAIGQKKHKRPLLSVLGSFARCAFLSMRPVQWTKSVLILLPLAFSWTLEDTGPVEEQFLRGLAAAIIFCALSGAVYILNDVLDRQSDRAHPRKRNRPIASGEFPVAGALVTATVLVVLSIPGSFLLGWEFGVASVVFLAMNLGYSSLIKRLIILDVMMVASGYLLRVVAGALVIDVAPSPWLYTTIGLGALFIALSKRYSELAAAEGNPAEQRAVLGQYSQAFLSQLIIISSTATLVAYSFYTFTSSEESNVPENHTMMLTIPFVIFGLFRYLHLVNHTHEPESPELVIIRDKPLVIAVVAWAATAMLVLALNR